VPSWQPIVGSKFWKPLMIPGLFETILGAEPKREAKDDDGDQTHD
jgi:hypothetical protein